MQIGSGIRLVAGGVPKLSKMILNKILKITYPSVKDIHMNQKGFWLSDNCTVIYVY